MVIDRTHRHVYCLLESRPAACCPARYPIKPCFDMLRSRPMAILALLLSGALLGPAPVSPAVATPPTTTGCWLDLSAARVVLEVNSSSSGPPSARAQLAVRMLLEEAGRRGAPGWSGPDVVERSEEGSG